MIDYFCKLCEVKVENALVQDDGLCPSCRLKAESIPQVSIANGWICPRCGTVNAPWKDKCDCIPAGWHGMIYKEP